MQVPTVMLKTPSVLRAPNLSPSKSKIHSSSKTSRIICRIPTKPGPRKYELAVMKQTMPPLLAVVALVGMHSNTFHSAKRQK